MTIDIVKEEQLCSLGDEAKVLLKTEAFKRTVNQLVDASFQAFCNSSAQDKDARELSYHHYRALVDIVSTLKQQLLLSLPLPPRSFIGTL